jgi:hypothetical protein
MSPQMDAPFSQQPTTNRPEPTTPILSLQPAGLSLSPQDDDVYCANSAGPQNWDLSKLLNI